MSFDLKHRRADGSFVVMLAGDLPYHVTADDPLFPEVQAAAEGVTLPAEPVALYPENVMPAPEPTRAELMARLMQIQAQIEALPEGDA